jgi:hypothetical protein
MNKNLSQIKSLVYDFIDYEILDLEKEQESQEYDACRFRLNEKSIISRSGKITPKKVGQFVSFWERNRHGITQPIKYISPFDYYIVNVKKENELGQFVFPKSVLIKKGIVSSPLKEGKRGFRVYPIWDIANNKQAQKTQEWQLDYFYSIQKPLDFNRIKRLYDSS